MGPFGRRRVNFVLCGPYAKLLTSSSRVNVCAYVGQYAQFILKDWKKATGKDGRLWKHETSSPQRAAFEMYT